MKSFMQSPPSDTLTTVGRSAAGSSKYDPLAFFSELKDTYAREIDKLNELKRLLAV